MDKAQIAAITLASLATQKRQKEDGLTAILATITKQTADAAVTILKSAAALLKAVDLAHTVAHVGTTILTIKITETTKTSFLLFLFIDKATKAYFSCFFY